MSAGTDFVLTGGAAEILQCSPDNIRYLERAGQLHAVRVDGVRLFQREEVERVKREREARAAARAAAHAA